jgi:aminoglycoside phosphotransferase (APT) family kinase protein
MLLRNAQTRVLTLPEIAQYLLDCNLLDRTSIVAGDFQVTEHVRRNRNVAVFTAKGPGYLIKQGTTPDTIMTVAHEGAIYKLMQPGASNGESLLGRYMPHYFKYDTDNGLLILQLLRDAEDLSRRHARTGRFSMQLGSATGKALARLHSLNNFNCVTETNQTGVLLPSRLPAALTIHRPHLSIALDASRAKLQLIKIIQKSDDLCNFLEEVRADWRKETLIHGDVKWANWLVLATRSSAPTVKLIDWELASLGDPSWDIGSALGSYLGFWLASVPVTQDGTITHSLELARCPLEKMVPALQSLWSAYVRLMRFNKSSATDLLLRSVRFAAVRLVQDALERVQQSETVTLDVVYLLQLATNILKRPHEASALLFKLPVGSST